MLWQEDAREAREHHNKELHELQDALQAQEQEVVQLHTDVSIAHEQCHEAESRAQELQDELTALQSSQTKAQEEQRFGKQQLQKLEARIAKQEVGGFKKVKEDVCLWDRVLQNYLLLLSVYKTEYLILPYNKSQRIQDKLEHCKICALK